MAGAEATPARFVEVERLCDILLRPVYSRSRDGRAMEILRNPKTEA